MHTIHHTTAVVLRRQASREHDALFWLFTEEFGLVVVVATGIRKPGAKLAGQLLEYAVVEVDLVKGKEWWRLISGSEVLTPLQGRTRSPLARAYVRMLGVLYRFLIDEGAHTDIFVLAREAAQMVARDQEVDPRVFDTLLIWRILVHLGYIAHQDSESVLLTGTIHSAIASMNEAATKRMIALVTRTLKESHL